MEEEEAVVKPFEAIPSPGGRLPLLGHMHKLDMARPWEAMERFRKELGEIYRCGIHLKVRYSIVLRNLLFF